MTLEELKQINWKAYRSLIDFWSELSRISVLRAKIDIEDDLGSRYTLEEGFNGITFSDSQTGDVFIYNEKKDSWDFR
jgi:hypothetical protein